MTASADDVRAAVGAVVDPELRQPIASMDMMREISVDDDGTAHVSIVLTVVGCPMAQKIETDVAAAAASVPGVRGVDVQVGTMAPAERAALVERLRGGRRRSDAFGPGSRIRVLAVTSGKGGVGKSTLTANLAVALAARGRRVGLADLDVHGFSIPALMGLVDAAGEMPHPTRIDDMILPPVAHDVKTISIGMFLRGSSDGQAVAWRGPLLHRTVQQFLSDVHFGDIDVLLLDMPPGTGDIAITVGQLLPSAEVLVGTTPQPAAADVAVRSGLVARQVGQHVLGVVENMTPAILPDGTVFDLFGAGGGRAVADALSDDDQTVPLLASVPLSPVLRRDGDDGTPAVLRDPGDPAAAAVIALAGRIDQELPRRHRAVNIGHTGSPAGPQDSR